MKIRTLRDILPKGLYWRTILIILVPAALLQLVITIVFLDDHWRFSSKRMSTAVAAEIGLLVELYARNPSSEGYADIERLAERRLSLDIELQPGAALAKPRCNQALSVIDRYFGNALTEAVAQPVWFDATCPGRFVEIRVALDRGVMRILARRDRVQAQSGPLFVLWVMGATLFLAAVSVVFIRNQVRPIETLAEAMDKVGRGADPGMFKARGAREVRQATLAFFEMRARLKRHIDQRAQLLAGVSHDLRTPITRMKLALAMMPADADTAALKADISDLEHTLEEYLAFARGQWSEEPAPADISALVREAADAARRSGANVTLSGVDLPYLEIRARAVRRALDNLIDNAVAHGETVAVTTALDGPDIQIHVEDDGPGLAEALYEDAFRPFSRLDETRSKNAKGVGLGLAIARDVARGHGGDVVLSRGALGGLRATLKLPG
jgi:two-component system, OmpR family, osmolarity sensor histidine kinase EnvZ